MRFLASGSIAAVLVLLAARPVLPACGDRPGDAGAVAATRAAAEARCDCAAATDHEQYALCVAGVANDPARDMVDLYGYTSMAVAALQTQAREIEALEREVRALRRELEKERGETRPR